MIVLWLGFGASWPKNLTKAVLGVLNMLCFTCTYIFRAFFHGSEFFADPDPEHWILVSFFVGWSSFFGLLLLARGVMEVTLFRCGWTCTPSCSSSSTGSSTLSSSSRSRSAGTMLVAAPFWSGSSRMQCCGSKYWYIEFGSGSRILAQFGSGSRVKLSNFEEEKI